MISMYSDRRMEKIVRALEYVKSGKLGLTKIVEGQFVECIEAYPFKSGFLVLITTEDTRKLSYKFRKILLYVNEQANFSILAECEIKNELAIDTCVTQDLIDANVEYEVLVNASKSKIFGKNKAKRLNDKVESCSKIAALAIEKINEKYLMKS